MYATPLFLAHLLQDNFFYFSKSATKTTFKQKTRRIWNRGHQPANTQTLGPGTGVGNQDLPPEEQGVTVLGAPIGRTLCPTLSEERPRRSQTLARPVTTPSGPFYLSYLC